MSSPPKHLWDQYLSVRENLTDSSQRLNLFQPQVIREFDLDDHAEALDSYDSGSAVPITLDDGCRGWELLWLGIGRLEEGRTGKIHLRHRYIRQCQSIYFWTAHFCVSVGLGVIQNVLLLLLLSLLLLLLFFPSVGNRRRIGQLQQLDRH